MVQLIPKQMCWKCAYKYFVSLAMEETSAMYRVVQMILVKVAVTCLYAFNFFNMSNLFLWHYRTQNVMFCVQPFVKYRD